MKKIVLLLIAGLMVGAIIVGCSTEEPWEPEPTRPLELVMVSAPDTATVIPHNSNVSFFWIVQGGSGEYTGCQWYLDPIESDWGETSQSTDTTYTNLPGSDIGTDYTFYVRVIDSDNNMDTVSAAFKVYITDDAAPAVSITESPVEGSYVATGTSVEFAWEGDDGYGNDDMIEYQYAFPTIDSISGWLNVTTVSFADVNANDPAIFYVRARDGFDNTSDWDSVSFIIQPATILYVDDFLWVDAYSEPNMPKERDQKQFYRDALEGYAFAEWDFAIQGMPDSSDLVVGGNPVYSTILWCSDSDVGSSDGTWWYDIAANNGGPLRYYLENGGNMLVTGPLVLNWANNTNPPSEGDFEYDWFGIDSIAGDEGLAWDIWWWFTWAVKDAATALDLPDSMKIDVAKNGDQDDYASEIIHFRDDATVSSEVIFTWGVWVDGEPPIYDPDYAHPYGWPVGYISTFTGQKTAMLLFDTYAMPLPEIRQTFTAILTEFGE